MIFSSVEDNKIMKVHGDLLSANIGHTQTMMIEKMSTGKIKALYNNSKLTKVIGL